MHTIHNKKGLKFNSTTVQKLKIIIDNKDNQPLSIDGILVKGYVHELTARFTENAKYFLTAIHPFTPTSSACTRALKPFPSKSTCDKADATSRKGHSLSFSSGAKVIILTPGGTSPTFVVCEIWSCCEILGTILMDAPSGIITVRSGYLLSPVTMYVKYIVTGWEKVFSTFNAPPADETSNAYFPEPISKAFISIPYKIS